MKNTKFTEEQIRAIYKLYIYGFSAYEISDMILGKRIYDIIKIKIDTILESILKYTEDKELYYSDHICNSINMDTILQDTTNCQKIIDSLKELQERIKQDVNSTMSEVFVDNIEQIIKIINNIEKVQHEYDILTQRIGETNYEEIRKVLSDTTYTTIIKDEVAKQIKVEPIITKEQWQKANLIIKNKN